MALPRTRSTTWDLLAGASAEVGVLFTGLTPRDGLDLGPADLGLVVGVGRALTTTAVLFFLYLGYLALRRTGVTAAERGKRSAIAALIAFVDVPIVHFSVNWLQTLHQDGTVFNRKIDVEIQGSMAVTLVLSVFAFTLLYGYLVTARLQLLELEEGFEERELERAIERRAASRAGRCPSDGPQLGLRRRRLHAHLRPLAAYSGWLWHRLRRTRRSLADEA